MRISDWSSDVCSSDLFAGWPDRGQAGDGLSGPGSRPLAAGALGGAGTGSAALVSATGDLARRPMAAATDADRCESRTDAATGTASRTRTGLGKTRSEEHTSELQSLMRSSYAVFCLKKKRSGRTSPVATTTARHSLHNRRARLK